MNIAYHPTLLKPVHIVLELLYRKLSISQTFQKHNYIGGCDFLYFLFVEQRVVTFLRREVYFGWKPLVMEDVIIRGVRDVCGNWTIFGLFQKSATKICSDENVVVKNPI